MATRIPAKTVTWYGVFHRMHLFSGRMLEAVLSTERECREWIKKEADTKFVNPNEFMIEPVNVRMAAYKF